MADKVQNPESARRISRWWPVLSSGIAIIAAVLLGLIVFVRGNTPLEADAEWMEEILEHRSPIWDVPALVMNFAGGGWFSFAVPIVFIGVLLFLRRFWAALYFGLAMGISPLLVQLLKGLFDRPRPEAILVHADLGSFPSGHSANAATLAVALGLVFWRLWIWAAGTIWVVLMMLSRTYLGAHWVSDTIGGLLLGAAVAVIIWVPFAHRLRMETAGRVSS
jgi:undecaprenyl-diphosphatase